MRARRTLNASPEVFGRVIELGEAEFGAQNLGATLERNGLRKHVVSIEVAEEGTPVIIASYWWRWPGTRVRILQRPGSTFSRFASDLYAPAAMLFGLSALSALVAAALISAPAW